VIADVVMINVKIFELKILDRIIIGFSFWMVVISILIFQEDILVVWMNQKCMGNIPSLVVIAIVIRLIVICVDMYRDEIIVIISRFEEIA